MTVTDTRDMVLVHRVFRREFRLLPLMVRHIADGDTRAAGQVSRHAREMLDALHHHHQNEDELLWPRLLQRTPSGTGLVERMQTQHHAVGEILQRIEWHCPCGSARPAPATRTPSPLTSGSYTHGWKSTSTRKSSTSSPSSRRRSHPPSGTSSPSAVSRRCRSAAPWSSSATSSSPPVPPSGPGSSAVCRRRSACSTGSSAGACSCGRPPPSAPAAQSHHPQHHRTSHPDQEVPNGHTAHRTPDH